MNIGLESDLAELPRLSAAVEAFGGQRGLSAHDRFELGLVLEEIFTNIVKYAFAGGGAHPVSISLDMVGDAVVAEITDHGRAFDPRSVPAPDLDADLEHRAIGGLGIHFVRTLTQDLAYERREGINHLSFRKRVKGRDGD